MSLEHHSTSSCCTAKCLYSFDGTEVSAFGFTEQPDYEKLKNRLLDKENYLRHCGEAILYAFLNSDQTVAAEVLKDSGYTCSGYGKSRKHYTTVSIWFKLLNPVEE